MPRTFLTGSRVLLRRLDDADVTDDYVAWLNDPDVTRYLETGKTPATPESIRAFLQRFDGSTTDYAFAIVERKSGRHIGNVTLNRINWIHRTADTGLMIGRKDAWGKGYASEVWGLLAGYAFDRLGLRKLIAGVVDGNVASLKSLEKIGFKLEGRLRAEYWVEGACRDALRLGLLREEFVSGAGTRRRRR